ncbi:PTS lactose/cellobiose transporter subunit IIA [Clostridium oceanicum]|uniref:PTS lichenan transporter subunit IIA n=1 Tax=Clostridium oceanicum TaxID=1543 RepID=A0ABN1JCV2_9CLOT
MLNENTIFTLILHSGDARSKSMNGIKLARQANFDEALELINEAGKDLNKAHQIQSELINNEINGNKTEISLLMVHAQDHLMTSMVVRDLAKEMILMKKEDSCKSV